MKKRLLIVLIIAFCVSCLTACGKVNPSEENDNGSTETIEQTQEQSEGQMQENVLSSDDNEEDYPKISIEILDDKHADFIFAMNSFSGFDFGEDSHFSFWIPEEYEVEWFGITNGLVDGNVQVQDPERALIFHPQYGGFGNAEVERTGQLCIIHIEVQPDPDANYDDELRNMIDKFSFVGFNGRCRLEYNDENGLKHEYEYDFNDIVDMDSYVSDEDEDNSTSPSISDNLIGTWKSEWEDSNGDGNGYTIYSFNADGTGTMRKYRDFHSDGSLVNDETYDIKWGIEDGYLRIDVNWGEVSDTALYDVTITGASMRIVAQYDPDHSSEVYYRQ